MALPISPDAPRLTPQTAAALMASRVEAVREYELVELAATRGRVLAESIVSDRASPPCTVSAMDGFAVRLDELGEPLPVVGEVRIGRAPPQLPNAASLRIVTGAPLPDGADTVLRMEDATLDGGFLRAQARPLRGANVRLKGENGPAGTAAAPPGSLVTAGALGAAAAFGCSALRVLRPLALTIIVTGDELEAIGAPVDDYQLRDSNGPALHALFERPWIAVRRAPRVPDDVAALQMAVEEALATSDAVVLTGGVSKGAYDYVPGVLSALGVEVLFHRLPQRPGHPVLGGITLSGVPVFGLPGNPLSAMVTGRRLVLPTIAARAGLSPRAAGLAPLLVTTADQRGLPNHWHFPLVTHRGDDAGRDVTVLNGRGSGDVIALGRSDGFIEVAPGQNGPGPWPFYGW